MSADQSVEDIVVKRNALPGTSAFNVFAEIDPRIIRTAHGIVPDSPHDVFKMLLLPGSIARIGDRGDLFDEIPEAVDFDGGSLADGFQNRDYSFSRHLIEGALRVGFRIGFAPSVSGHFFVNGANTRKVTIFDYVDRAVPMLMKMFEKRLRGYRTIGYARDEAPLGLREIEDEAVVEYDEELLRNPLEEET